MGVIFPVSLVLAFLLEPTLGARINLLGGHPLFVLGLVIYFALVKGAPAGTLFGWLMGFLCDMTTIGNMGLRSFSYSVVGFTVGNTWDSVYKDNGWTQAVILFLGVLIQGSLVYFVVTRLALGDYIPFLIRNVAPTAAVTAAAFPLMLAAFERLARKEISFDARRVVIRRRR
jgi:rod shape-determining protein MreD